MGVHQERVPRPVHQLGRVALQNVRRARLRLPRTLRLHVGQRLPPRRPSRQIPNLHSGTLFIYLFNFCLIPVDSCFSNSIDFDCFLAGVVTEIECFTCRVYRAAAAALPALNRLRCASVRPAPKKWSSWAGTRAPPRANSHSGTAFRCNRHFRFIHRPILIFYFVLLCFCFLDQILVIFWSNFGNFLIKFWQFFIKFWQCFFFVSNDWFHFNWLEIRTWVLFHFRSATLPAGNGLTDWFHWRVIGWWWGMLACSFSSRSLIWDWSFSGITAPAPTSDSIPNGRVS